MNLIDRFRNLYSIGLPGKFNFLNEKRQIFFLRVFSVKFALICIEKLAKKVVLCVGVARQAFLQRNETMLLFNKYKNYKIIVFDTRSLFFRI